MYPNYQSVTVQLELHPEDCWKKDSWGRSSQCHEEIRIDVKQKNNWFKHGRNQDVVMWMGAYLCAWHVYRKDNNRTKQNIIAGTFKQMSLMCQGETYKEVILSKLCKEGGIDPFNLFPCTLLKG